LTVAPVEAFIKFSVPKSKSLSFIGGDLRIDGKLPNLISEEIVIEDRKNVYLYGGVPDIDFSSELYAESGQINLASIASQGDVMPTNLDGSR